MEDVQPGGAEQVPDEPRDGEVPQQVVMTGGLRLPRMGVRNG